MNNDGLLTHILNAFTHAFGAGFGRLESSSWHLLGTMTAIDLVLFGMFYALAPEGSIVAKGFRKLLGYGFFIMLVTQWPHLTHMLVNGFMWAGKTAGGGSGISVQDPSGIISYGFTVAQPLLDAAEKLGNGWMGAMGHMTTMTMLVLCIIGILVAFLIMAIQCFMAYLEFMIVAVLSMVLLPFGVWKHTKFLSEKSLGAVLSHGIKLMTLTFVIAVAGTVFPLLIPAGTMTIHTAFVTLGATIAIAMLCFQAPNLASGLMSGSPSLGAGALLGTTAGAAMGGMAALRGGRQLAGGAASAGKSGASAAAAAAGAISQGAAAGIAAKGAGASFAAKAAGAAMGGAGAAAAGLASKATSPLRNAASAARGNFQKGQVAQHTRTSGAGSTPTGPTKTPPANGRGSTAPAGNTPAGNKADGNTAGKSSPADLITKPAGSVGPAGGTSTPPTGAKGAGRTGGLAQRALDQARPGDGGNGSVQVNLPTHED